MNFFYGKTTRTGKGLLAIQRETRDRRAVPRFPLKRCGGLKVCGVLNATRIPPSSTAEDTRNYKNRKTGKTEIRAAPARHLYQCLSSEFGHQFSATAGTIFNDSHLPPHKWLLATAIMCNAKKGISAKELQRDLEVSYKTAYYLSLRVREEMAAGNL